jgi:hypothetical protein
MTCFSRVLAVALIAAVLGSGLVGCSRLGLPTAQPDQTTVQQSVLIDQQAVSMEWEPGIGSPPVDQNRALTLAASYVPGSTATTPVESRYVRLTLRDSDGKVVAGVQARPVWLVTFRGVAYLPAGSSATVCACATIYQRPSTVVSLDAQTGALITLLGADS